MERPSGACGLAFFVGLVVWSQPVIVERVAVPSEIKANRELRLWMQSPKKVDRGPLKDNPYSCPEMTYGSYLIGKARLSLVDTATGAVLNTIPVVDKGSNDTFRMPYRILAGLYYNVPGTKRHEEGKPRLLDLRDLNGDGNALEFALFNAEACMGLATSLWGYSVKQDRVMQYLTEFSPDGKTSLSGWVDYLFSQKPVSPGVWSYQIDYRGRMGPLVEYKVKYVADRERFVGAVRAVDGPGSAPRKK